MKPGGQTHSWILILLGNNSTLIEYLMHCSILCFHEITRGINLPLNSHWEDWCLRLSSVWSLAVDVWHARLSGFDIYIVCDSIYTQHVETNKKPESQQPSWNRLHLTFRGVNYSLMHTPKQLLALRNHTARVNESISIPSSCFVQALAKEKIMKWCRNIIFYSEVTSY